MNGKNEYGKKDFFVEEKSFKTKIFEICYLTLILLGIVIFFIGGIIRASTGFDFNWNESYIDNIRAGALIIMNIGILISSIGFMLGALKDSELDIKIRGSMIIATGSCIIAGAVVNIILFM